MDYHSTTAEYMGLHITDFDDPEILAAMTKHLPAFNVLERLPQEWTPEDRKLAEFFSWFRYEVGYSYNKFSKQFMGTGYPWDYRDWMESDPVVMEWIKSKRELPYIADDFPPSQLNYNGLPIPRHLYFAFATAQAMRMQADHARMKLDEQPPVELEVTIDDAGGFFFPSYNTLGITQEELLYALWNHVMNVLMVGQFRGHWAKRHAQESGYTTALAQYSNDPFWYPPSMLSQVEFLTDPFWYWGPLPNAAVYSPDYNDRTNPWFGISLEAGHCPKEFPALVMKPRRYQLVAEVLAQDKITNTYVKTYEVTMPPSSGGEFSMLRGAYEGAYLDAPIGPITGSSAPTSESVSTNTSTTSTEGGTTVVVEEARYVTFDVHDYRFGPHLIEPGHLGGFSNQPILNLVGKEGFAEIKRSNDSDEYRRLMEKAEAMAKEKLIEFWGFTPAWINQYGGTVDSYVQIWRGGNLRDLPYWKFIYDEVPGEIKFQMDDFDFIWPYMFSIVVMLSPEKTTTTTTGGSTTTTTVTIETVEERDPVTYTVSETVNHSEYKLRLRLRWVPLETDYYKVPLANMFPSYLHDTEKWGSYWDDQMPWSHQLFVAVENGLRVGVEELPTHKLMLIPEEERDPTWPAWIDYWKLDPTGIELPALTFEQSYEVTKDLFRPDHTILNYLNLGFDAKDKATKVLGQVLGTLQGNVFLTQQGSPFPVYPTFQESLVFDTHLQKWGKLSIPHKLLAELSPVNSNIGNKIAASTFTVQAALLDPLGQLFTFNDTPNDSELRFGKLGYHRLGFTDMEELRVQHSKASSGIIQIEPSISGDTPELMLVEQVPFTGATYTTTHHNVSARWYNITVKGTYDIKSIEFIGRKSARR